MAAFYMSLLMGVSGRIGLGTLGEWMFQPFIRTPQEEPRHRGGSIDVSHGWPHQLLGVNCVPVQGSRRRAQGYELRVGKRQGTPCVRLEMARNLPDCHPTHPSSALQLGLDTVTSSFGAAAQVCIKPANKQIRSG